MCDCFPYNTNLFLDTSVCDCKFHNHLNPYLVIKVSQIPIILFYMCERKTNHLKQVIYLPAEGRTQRVQRPPS